MIGISTTRNTKRCYRHLQFVTVIKNDKPIHVLRNLPTCTRPPLSVRPVKLKSHSTEWEYLFQEFFHSPSVIFVLTYCGRFLSKTVRNQLLQVMSWRACAFQYFVVDTCRHTHYRFCGRYPYSVMSRPSHNHCLVWLDNCMTDFKTVQSQAVCEERLPIVERELRSKAWLIGM